MDHPIIIAQATALPPAAGKPASPAAPGISLTTPKSPSLPQYSAPGMGSPAGQTTTVGTTRKIESKDILDAMGLGPAADIVVMSVLCLICGAMITGVVLALLRKAFGSKDDKKAAFDIAEKQVFELKVRKARGTEKCSGLTRQADALVSKLREATNG